jgi:transposase
MITEHTAITEPVRRIEVFTGTGRRRSWSAEGKARIVAESMASGTSVCSVARRHGLAPQQLFGWRREARESVASNADANGAGLFVPAIVETSGTTAVFAAPSPERVRKRKERYFNAPPMIELEIDGVTVRVSRGAEAKTIAAVIRALKAKA